MIAVAPTTSQELPVRCSFSSEDTGAKGYAQKAESAFGPGRLGPHGIYLGGDATHEIMITNLPGYDVKKPLGATLERDGDEYLVESVDLPLYGCGRDKREALSMLKREIESLYEDLLGDGNLTDEWLGYKEMLSGALRRKE